MTKQQKAVDPIVRSGGNPVGRPKKPENEQSTKIQVTLPYNLANRLEELQSVTHHSSVPDFIRQALMFYAAAINQHREGGKILFRDADGSERELAIFI